MVEAQDRNMSPMTKWQSDNFCIVSYLTCALDLGVVLEMGRLSTAEGMRACLNRHFT